MTALDVIRPLAKVDLHVHLVGTLTASMAATFAVRNGLDWRPSVSTQPEGGLERFLAASQRDCETIVEPQDFYDLTYDYLMRARRDGIVGAELTFAPTQFLARGYTAARFMDPILEALQQAPRHGLRAGLILACDRAAGVKAALDMLEAVQPWTGRVLGLGLVGAERGHAPAPYAEVFEIARSVGLRTTAHAGEEGPADYIRQAIDLLGVERIDHGNAVLADIQLTRRVHELGIPLMMCPLSNLQLGVTPILARHPIMASLAAGLNVSVHSDDPAYFGGMVSANLSALVNEAELSWAQCSTLINNGLAATWLEGLDGDLAGAC